MDRGFLRQIEHLLRPIAHRVANLVQRAVVQRVDDASTLQGLQIGANGEVDADDAEHHQPFGFSSVPLAGAEAITIFPGGNREHPITIAVSDRRHRPTGGEAGEVVVYNHTGAKITITKDGDIEVQPAPGREVFVRDEGGTADRLVKKSEFDGHIHPAGALAAPSGGGAVTGATGGAAPVVGTTRLKAQ